MMASPSLVWFNGQLIAEDQPVYTALDRIRLGDGVFDTLLCLDGRALHINLHWQRLAENCAVLDIPFALTMQHFEDAIMGLIETHHAQQGCFVMNTVISRGQGSRGLAPPDTASPSTLIRLTAITNSFEPLVGRIITSVRRNEGSPLSRVKSFNYGDNILALQDARRRGGNEAIMLNNAGHVTCASAANIFMIKDGQIITPPLSDGVLNGVARQIFMQRYPVAERSITPQELLSADHIFLTNSLRGAQAFHMVDSKKFSALPLDIDPQFHIL